MRRLLSLLLRKRLLAVAALFVVVLALLDRAADDEGRADDAADSLLEQDFDYYMTGVDSTSFSLDGNRRFRLQAERATHFPDPEYTLVDRPNLVVYREQGNPWHITAQHGRITPERGAGGERVELSEDVVITHEDEEGRELNVYTEFLTLYPERKLASTNLEVRFVMDGGELTGTGMVADLNARRVELLANVRGRYE